MKRPGSRNAVKEYWTFRHESNKKFSHGLHRYPARMHPEIASHIIADYGDKKTLVIDPFLGSAGVICEALLKENNAVGFDINPFAILLAKVKTSIINPKKTEIEYKRILKKSISDYKGGKFYPRSIPYEYDVEYWNKPSVIKKLSILKHHIFNSNENTKMQNFLKICFSLTSRNSSNLRKYEFKPWRMNGEELKSFRPNVFEIFNQICEKNCSLMADFKFAMKGKKSKSIVRYGNAKNLSENFRKIKADFVDDAKKHLVITSPPYGDSSTTVAYGQFSLFPGLWLDLPTKQLKEVDKVCLGGKRHYAEKNFLPSSRLNSRLKEISKQDVKRAVDVFSFFYDFDQCLLELSKILKNDSHLCFVVANRTVKRVSIHTDKILIDLSKKYHFKHVATYPRFIPIKVMPYKNAPENITKNAGKTMAEERIVILKN